MAVNEFGDGRSVYISGLPYSFANSRVLYRAILWASHSEEDLNKWFSTNYNVEVHAFVKNGKYCVVNEYLRASAYHRVHRYRFLPLGSRRQRDQVVRDLIPYRIFIMSKPSLGCKGRLFAVLSGRI